jgi:predicted metal-binding membrane protein
MIGLDLGQMTRERNLILALLLALAVAAWGVLLWQSRQMAGEAADLTMGVGFVVFLANWIVMMVAMMFPTAAPMILTFSRVSDSRRQRGRSFVPTWVFVTAYLVVWTLFGVAAYVLALGVSALASGSPWLIEQAGRIGGLVLMLAGLYQLSPLKNVCLTRCRAPMDFVLNAWRDGFGGAFRMGLEHGWYCLGCCWLLFVILFPLGVMNVGAMAAITLLIFAEKALPIGQQARRAAALALLAYGALVVVLPWLLPTAISTGSAMDM